jgi:hypothetical protein
MKYAGVLEITGIYRLVTVSKYIRCSWRVWTVTQRTDHEKGWVVLAFDSIVKQETPRERTDIPEWIVEKWKLLACISHNKSNKPQEQKVLLLATLLVVAVHRHLCNTEIWRCERWVCMIYLLTAIGLSPGGSSTVHIYTQTIHRTIQNKQYMEQHNNFGRVQAMPRLG